MKHQEGTELYIVYAIYSDTRNYMYVGMTNDLERRISEHNLGYNKTTKPYRPFKLIYHECHSTREEARKREKYFKTSPGKRYLRRLI